MDFANDGDLFQKITKMKKTQQQFQEEQVWKIVIGAVSGLKKLHELKVFHRDIKSVNLFLERDGGALLGDMNVSKVAKAGFLYTQTGTPYYASPEVWNDKPYNSKSDIWSLGCVLYETLTLHPPFRAANMNDLYKRVVKGVFDDPPNLYSRDLKRLIKSMITVQPDLRPSANQILQSREVAKAIKYFNLDLSDTVPELASMKPSQVSLGLATITHTVDQSPITASHSELLKTI